MHSGPVRPPVHMYQELGFYVSGKLILKCYLLNDFDHMTEATPPNRRFAVSDITLGENREL